MKALTLPIILLVTTLILCPFESLDAGLRQVAYYDAAGRAVYKERYLQGRTKYGTPVYAWRIIHRNTRAPQRIHTGNRGRQQARVPARRSGQSTTRFPSHVNNSRFLSNHPSYSRSHVRVPTRQPSSVRRPAPARPTAPARRTAPVRRR